MAEVPRKIERKNPVHRALALLLKHMAIHQPEVAPDCMELTENLDDLFSKEIEWEAAIEDLRQQRQQQQTDPPKPPAGEGV